MKRILVQVAALVGAFFFITAGFAEAKNSADRIDGTEVPIEIYDGYLIVVQGQIGPLAGLHFLVDTGQTNTSIDRSIAAKLGLGVWREQGAKVLNFDKPVAADWTTLPDLRFGPIDEAGFLVMVANLGYLRGSGTRIDGVIGLDLLRTRNALRIDFRQKKLILNPPTPLEGRVTSMHLQTQTITVEIELDSRPTPMILDTGMRGTVFYREALENHAMHYLAQPQFSDLKGASAGGMVDFMAALVPSMRLGGQNLTREAYLLMKPGASGPNGIAGFLGLSTLRAKIVELDFNRQELRWSN